MAIFFPNKTTQKFLHLFLSFVYPALGTHLFFFAYKPVTGRAPRVLKKIHITHIPHSDDVLQPFFLPHYLVHLLKLMLIGANDAHTIL